jgi:antitoxin (DNA-binding transcriptional repressor) of toxin-antitoxin stability system
MHQITIQEAETHFPLVLQDVLHGEEVLIMDKNEPVAKVIPLKSPGKKPRIFGSAKGLIKMSDDFNETPEDFKDYM